MIIERHAHHRLGSSHHRGTEQAHGPPVHLGGAAGERHCMNGMGHREGRRSERIRHRGVADECGSYCIDAGRHKVDGDMSVTFPKTQIYSQECNFFRQHLRRTH